MEARQGAEQREERDFLWAISLSTAGSHYSNGCFHQVDNCYREILPPQAPGVVQVPSHPCVRAGGRENFHPTAVPGLHTASWAGGTEPLQPVELQAFTFTAAKNLSKRLMARASVSG